MNTTTLELSARPKFPTPQGGYAAFTNATRVDDLLSFLNAPRYWQSMAGPQQAAAKLAEMAPDLAFLPIAQLLLDDRYPLIDRKYLRRVLRSIGPAAVPSALELCRRSTGRSERHEVLELVASMRFEAPSIHDIFIENLYRPHPDREDVELAIKAMKSKAVKPLLARLNYGIERLRRGDNTEARFLYDLRCALESYYRLYLGAKEQKLIDSNAW